MRRNVIETVLGAVVLVVAGFFLFFAYTTGNVRSTGGYPLEASFTSTGGIASGADVRISGVKVGTVVGQRLDKDSFQAVLTLEIDNAVKLPEDTVAAIASESLLGGRFIDLQPGGAEEMLQAGARLQFTQSAVNLEDLLGRFIFSSTGGGAQGGAQGANGAAPAGQGAQPSGAQPGGLLGGQ